DDRTGDPIDGRTGAEAARFDEQGRRLPAAEQSRRAIEIIAVRVTKTPRSPAALLLLNTTDQDIDIGGWSLSTARDNNLGLVGAVRSGQPLAIDLPETSFDADGGVVTLLDASGLKVAAATYPASSDLLPGWHKIA